MQVFRGRSFEQNAESAVRELTAGWPAKPDVVLTFVSTKQDPNEIARVLHEKFPGCVVVGCTSTGEQLDGAHSNGAVVATAFVKPGSSWAATRIDGLSSFTPEKAARAVDTLFSSLAVDRDTFDPRHYVCFLFIDGLSMKEEPVAATVADALCGITLVGGSAGDDLAFKETRVILDGDARSDAAVILLAHVPDGYEVFKHQHFVTTRTALAVTKVDMAQRRVYELDGLPAADAYAAALSMRREDLTSEIALAHPVTFTCGREIYVRSIQRFDDDGSIVFYCAVEEGMVLNIGGHEDMVDAFARDLQSFRDRHGRVAALVTCNCILRALEAEKSKIHDRLGAVLQATAESSIGFDTYGEQLNGLHINQTMVAVAFT